MNNEVKSSALKVVEIDGFTFEFYQISPRELLSLLWKVTGILGMSIKGPVGAQRIDMSKLDTSDIIGNLFEKLDEKSFLEISDRLLAKATVTMPKDSELRGGQLSVRVTYDAAFSGDHGLLRFFKVMVEAAGCYYGAFFADLSGLVGMRAGTVKDLAAKLMSRSMDTSGGQSSQG